MPKSVSKKRQRPHSKGLDKKMREVKTKAKKLISKLEQLTNKKNLERIKDFGKIMAELLVNLILLVRTLKAAKAEMIKQPVKRKVGQKTRKQVKN